MTGVILIRPVTQAECPWLDRNFPAGTEVYFWAGHDYGCISDTGVAVSLYQGEHPFFEIPADAIGTFHKSRLPEMQWPGCCSCSPGDGTDECESYDDCYGAWHRFTYPEDQAS